MKVLQISVFPHNYYLDFLTLQIIAPPPQINASAFAGAPTMYLICLLVMPALDLCHLLHGVN